MSSKILWSHTV